MRTLIEAVFPRFWKEMNFSKFFKSRNICVAKNKEVCMAPEASEMEAVEEFYRLQTELEYFQIHNYEAVAEQIRDTEEKIVDRRKDVMSFCSQRALVNPGEAWAIKTLVEVIDAGQKIPDITKADFISALSAHGTMASDFLEDEPQWYGCFCQGWQERGTSFPWSLHDTRSGVERAFNWLYDRNYEAYMSELCGIDTSAWKAWDVRKFKENFEHQARKFILAKSCQDPEYHDRAERLAKAQWKLMRYSHLLSSVIRLIE